MFGFEPDMLRFTALSMGLGALNLAVVGLVARLPENAPAGVVAGVAVGTIIGVANSVVIAYLAPHLLN